MEELKKNKSLYNKMVEKILNDPAVNTALVELELNCGENFLSGEESNPSIENEKIREKKEELTEYNSTDASLSDSIRAVGQLGLTGLGAVAVGTEAVKSYDDIIIGLTSEIVNIIVKESSEMIATASLKILAPPNPMDINRYAVEYFNEQRKNHPFESYLKDLGTSSEKLAKMHQEKSKEEITADFNKKTAEKMNNINSFITKYVGQATDLISGVMTCVANGPAWLAYQLSTEVNNSLDYVRNYIDTNLEEIENRKQEWAKKQGEAGGKELFNQYDKQMKRLAKKQLDQVNKEKSKAMIKAKIIAQKALLKIMSFTGINIPLGI